MSAEFLICNVRILTFVTCLIRHFGIYIHEYFSNCLVGTCQTWYRYYCASLITVLQLWVLPLTLTRNPLQTTTVIQSNIRVKTSSLGNGDESGKKDYLYFPLKINFSKTSLSVLQELWVTLFIRPSFSYNVKVRPMGVFVTAKMQTEMIYGVQHWQWKIPQNSEHGPPYLPKGKMQTL
jgi:hypothetical protein